MLPASTALALALLWLPPEARSPLPVTPPGRAQERQSLEHLLREARTKGRAVQATLGAEIAAAMKDLEDLAGSGKADEVGALVERLVGYGPPAAPALVAFLDPGESAPAAAVFRAQGVVGVLRELASPAITDQLLDLARSGGLERRRNALAVLATSPEPERVVPAVRGLLSDPDGGVRSAALSTLGKLGGPEALAVLREALDDDEDQVVSAALEAMGSVGGEEVAALVLEREVQPGYERHLDALARFYAQRAELLLEEDHQTAIAELVARSAAAKSDVLRMLQLFIVHEVAPRPSARRALSSLGDHVNDQLRECALILLSRARDKGARRDFLKPYNDRVDRNEDYHEVYTQRGDAYYRLGEYPAAIKDFRRAIALQSQRNPDAEPYFGIARSYSRMGRFKDAADYLNTAPAVSLQVLRGLASDPAFAEMVNSRYRTAFHLPE